ncbi:MAG TPA: hypothetical protein VL728_18410 [Cyclobacteriaceae bacterium]|jgi:hypothetical protein|nr:hypothetical protein [Cyclobacteriaceae bacterium]
MKWIVGVSVTIAMALLLGMGVIANTKSAEELLIGSWEEVSWKYEKYGQRTPPDAQWHELSENLIVHQAETWNFEDGNKFVISPRKTNENAATSSWHIKGRGNILELKEGNAIEHYQIENVTQDSFTLFFSFDLQVKGIVRITFRRVK